MNEIFKGGKIHFKKEAGRVTGVSITDAIKIALNYTQRNPIKLEGII